MGYWCIKKLYFVSIIFYIWREKIFYTCEWGFFPLDELRLQGVEKRESHEAKPSGLSSFETPCNLNESSGKTPRTGVKNFLTTNLENYTNRLLFLMIMLFF